MGFNLYDEYGWININEIAKLGKWLNVIIGPRQVGKTYSTLKYLLERNLYFMYVRRTKAEFELMETDSDINPFIKMKSEGYQIDIVEHKGVRTIGYASYNDGKVRIERKIGTGMTLEQMAGIRGFNGDKFTDVMFDEFIPEKIVRKRAGEGDALLNAYTTINGNRELFGRPPVRMWLLANSNDLNSEILESLMLTEEVEKLVRRNKEFTITENYFLSLPHSEKVIEKRKETALMKHLNGQGKFYDMAINNIFAYNDNTLIKNMSIRGMRCIAKLCGYYVYDANDIYYVTTIPSRTRKVYHETDTDRIRFQLDFPEFRIMYSMGYVYFKSAMIQKRISNFLKTA